MARPEKLPDFDDVIARTQSRTLAVDLSGLLGASTLVGSNPVPTVTPVIVNGTDAAPLTRVANVALTAGSAGASKAISFQLTLEPGIYRLVYWSKASNGDFVSAYNHIRAIVP